MEDESGLSLGEDDKKKGTKSAEKMQNRSRVHIPLNAFTQLMREPLKLLHK